MKKINLQYSIKVAQAGLLIASSMFILGCDSSSSVTGGSSVATGLSMKVIDAKGLPVEGASVTVLAGGDPDDVIAENDESQTTGADGIADFDSTIVSKIINLKAFKAGYFSNTIAATTTENPKVTEIVIAKKESVKDAIRYSSADGSGAVGFKVEVLGEAANAPIKSEVVVPPNLLNENGDAIGDVVLEVAHFDSQETEALDSFPGGFSAQIENSGDINTTAIGGVQGSGGDINFVSAGFVAVELRDKTTGEKITKFDSSTPLTITMNIDPQAQFPLANGETRAVATGDIIPVWSYDSDTGKWRYEGKGTVSDPGGNGVLAVTYKVTHLSYYNLDWWFWGGDGAQTCDATINLGYSVYPNDIKGMIYRVGGGWKHHFYHDAAENSTSFTLLSAPKDINVKMTLTDLETGAIIYTSPRPFNLCNDGPITVELPTPTGSTGSGG